MLDSQHPDRSGPRRQRTRQIASLVATNATLLTASMFAAAGPAAADSSINPATDSVVYAIQNQMSGLVAEDQGGSDSAGNTIDQWGNWGGANQQWSIVSGTGADAGYYSIVNNQSGMCLNVSGASTAQNAPIIQWTCNGQANEQWQINYTGSWTNGGAHRHDRQHELRPGPQRFRQQRRE
jgi:Ricin-type beta-trefoil lectin domain-like